MEANELRIGNKLTLEDYIYTVYGIKYDKLELTIENEEDYIHDINIDKIEPILLNEEWLFKFGFEKDDSFDFKKKGFEITLYPDRKIHILGTKFNLTCEYVHQLQNIYFALIGVELELKND